MITFCIDPGTRRNCGIAVFHGLRMLTAWLADGPSSVPSVSFDLAGEACEVVLEVPRVYPGNRAKADPNDLIKLAVAAGRAAQSIVDMCEKMHAAAGSVAVVLIAPSTWKAQTDPDIMCERVLGALDDDEKKAFDGISQSIPQGAQHNVIDAVGIGLWRVGRMRPGGAGR